LDVISTDMLPEEIKALKSTINDEPLDIYNQEVHAGYYYQYSKNSLQLNVGNGKKFVDMSPVLRYVCNGLDVVAIGARF
jgi:hypothetical protein